jgi:hypothetical protein
MQREPIHNESALDILREFLLSAEGQGYHLYTDGSFKEVGTLEEKLFKLSQEASAAAGLVCIHNSEDWRSRPIFSLHIRDGEAAGASSAYSMEFIGMLRALLVVPDGGINQMIHSDGKSVIDTITKHAHRTDTKREPTR